MTPLPPPYRSLRRPGQRFPINVFVDIIDVEGGGVAVTIGTETERRCLGIFSQPYDAALFVKAFQDDTEIRVADIE